MTSAPKRCGAGCGRPVAAGRRRYCDDPWCEKHRRSVERVASYQRCSKAEPKQQRPCENCTRLLWIIPSRVGPYGSFCQTRQPCKTAYHRARKRGNLTAA